MDDLTEERLRSLATEDKLKFIANTPSQGVANSRDLARMGLLLLTELDELRDWVRQRGKCAMGGGECHNYDRECLDDQRLSGPCMTQIQAKKAGCSCYTEETECGKCLYCKLIGWTDE